MILKFNCKNPENELIPFHILMLSIPFNTDNPEYYVAILGNSDNIKIIEFCDKNPEQCLIDIRNFLARFNYSPQDLSYDILLEPADEFAIYIRNFFAH